MQNGVSSSIREASVQEENGRLLGKGGRPPLVSAMVTSIPFGTDERSSFPLPLRYRL